MDDGGSRQPGAGRRDGSGQSAVGTNDDERQSGDRAIGMDDGGSRQSGWESGAGSRTTTDEAARG
jgi:hypothetical protein